MKKYFPLILRIVVAVILIQTLRFKFTAHPDSVFIFSQVGLEPVGRIGIGVTELIAAILLLIPRTVWLGATLVIGILAGAIIMHLTSIGIEVKGDGGTLFGMAIGTFIMGAILLWLYRKQIPVIGEKL
ncbi:DoxX family protein [Leptobacterium flavescens]|uniref:DoxX family protein n=1 Tax=Leptobacterium flavescens TaxID=472055 RepID=A0A6P0UGL8_9FLAO|nr:DoxX family protein [Leptobacterium flavescens]NER12385.1 DoxX family protein [Leptobacterium flavescens]